jgi:hypothetical protein
MFRMNKFPRLYSFAKKKDISVAHFLTHNQLQDQFHLPLSVEAFQEYQQMQQIIQQIQISGQEKDSWSYIWGNNRYTSSKFYHFPYRNVEPPPPFIWIWDSRCSNKLKVFVWLLLMDMLNVRNILRRKKHKIQDNNYNCPICTMNVEETTFHLFFKCPFSTQCWKHLGITWDFNLPFHMMMVKARHLFNSDFFMEIFILGTCLIWKQRNNSIFNRGRATLQGWKKGFIEEAMLQTHRIQHNKQASFFSLVDLYR